MQIDFFFQGSQGVVGARGEKGPRGSVGEAGVQGSSGATGRPGQAVSCPNQSQLNKLFTGNTITFNAHRQWQTG